MRHLRRSFACLCRYVIQLLSELALLCSYVYISSAILWDQRHCIFQFKNPCRQRSRTTPCPSWFIWIWVRFVSTRSPFTKLTARMLQNDQLSLCSSRSSCEFLSIAKPTVNLYPRLDHRLIRSSKPLVDDVPHHGYLSVLHWQHVLSARVYWSNGCHFTWKYVVFSLHLKVRLTLKLF